MTPPLSDRPVGVFARADHPEGWGFANGTAHGYVVVFVRCADAVELTEVAARLRNRPFHGKQDVRQYTDGNLHAWYGGRFDLVATVSDVQVDYGPFRSLGDNRMVAVFEASDVLGDDGAS